MSVSTTALHNCLGSSLLGQELSGDQLGMLVTHMNLLTFQAGAWIAQSNTPADFVGIITEGRADVHLDQVKMSSLSSGDFFGEAMFSPEAIRTADILALSDVTVGVLTLDGFEALLAQDYRLAMRCKAFFERRYAQYPRGPELLNGSDETKYIALIAHNKMKPLLMDFVRTHKALLQKYPLVATGTTGAMLHRGAGLLLSRKVQSGPLGGDQAIGAMISTGNILAIIFFRDPLSAHPHHADIEALGRLSDVYQVPFATNPTTAVAVLDYIERGESSEFMNPAVGSYLQQQADVISQ